MLTHQSHISLAPVFFCLLVLVLQNKRRQPGPNDSGEEHSFHQKTYCLKLKKVLENICILF